MQKPKDDNNEPIVDLKHGGEVVLQVMPEDIQVVSNPDCKHERCFYDETDIEYDTFRCRNCPMVWVYPKGSFVVKLK